MSYKGLLTQTCDIKRKTTSFGSRGQSDVTWSTVESSVKCNIQLATRAEEYELSARGERSLTTFLGFFLYGTDIKEGDKVVLSTGQKFHVNYCHMDTVGRGNHIEADLELIRES